MTVAATFTAVPALRVSLAHCIAHAAASIFDVRTARDRHIAISHAHRRLIMTLKDHAEDLVCLRMRRQEMMRSRLKQEEDADVFEAEAEPRPSPHMAHATQSASRPSLQQLMEENRVMERESQRCQELLVDAALSRNALGTAEEPIGLHLGRLEREAAWSANEQVLLMEINHCRARSISTRAEMSRMEETLVGLEANFAKSRRQMVLKEQELIMCIGGVEEELATLSEGLAAKREAVREVQDQVFDARLELAERMVVLQAAAEGSGTAEGEAAPLAALEERLAGEVGVLQAKAEELQKRVLRAKASAKKR
jgi:hypothetical protein